MDREKLREFGLGGDYVVLRVCKRKGKEMSRDEEGYTPPWIQWIPDRQPTGSGVKSSISSGSLERFV